MAAAASSSTSAVASSSSAAVEQFRCDEVLDEGMKRVKVFATSSKNK